jgi:hypothetical protein
MDLLYAFIPVPEFRFLAPSSIETEALVALLNDAGAAVVGFRFGKNSFAVMLYHNTGTRRH